MEHFGLKLLLMNMGSEFKFGKPSASFLLSSRLAKSASDAANSLFLSRFAKCVEITRKKAGEVDESYTSVTCRCCLSQKAMPLGERIYVCECCGHQEDRDINAAYQIAFREYKDKIDKRGQVIIKKNGKLSDRGMKFVAESATSGFPSSGPLQAQLL